MIVQFLGLLDMFAGGLLLLLHFELFTSLAAFIGAYLMLKGFLFVGTPVSFLDMVAGGIIIYASFFGFSGFMVFVALWLFQKGVFSLFQ